MKVAIVTRASGFQGGIERYAHDLAHDLARRGHTLVLGHHGEAGRDPERFTSPFAEVIDLRVGRPDVLARGGVDVAYVQKATHPRELEPLGATRLLLAAHDHDLTCARRHRLLPLDSTPCHRAPGLACIGHGCFVERTRGRSLPLALVSPLALPGRLHALAARAPLVACSAYVAGGLVAAGVDPRRVHVVHPVPEIPEAPMMPLLPDVPDRAERLFFFGQLVRGKGGDLAIDALTHLPSQYTLDVVGDGPSRAAWEAHASAVAPGRVRFHGYVAPEGLDALYASAGLVVVPSRWPEPFGMVGIEAMARGRAVVGARHGGIPEWLDDGIGRLFAPLDARDLARAILEASREPGLGERARRAVRERFSRAAMVTRIERLLEGAA
jgi:glycosyltransferase involved in cell wall biosynthesis